MSLRLGLPRNAPKCGLEVPQAHLGWGASIGTNLTTDRLAMGAMRLIMARLIINCVATMTKPPEISLMVMVASIIDRQVTI